MFGGVQAGSAFVEISPDLSSFQQQLGTQMAPVTSKFGKIGAAGGAALAAGVAAVGIGKVLYDIGAEFDDAFDTIQTGTGATGQKLEGLKSSFKNVVSAVPADFGDAADAISQLNQRLGLSGKPLERLSAQMLELSRITGTDLETNIAAVTRTFGDWGIKTAQQPAFLDKMFRASQRTGISVADLGEQMVRYGAPLRQMGFGFSEAAAMVGKFEKEGVNAQLVMGSLRIALGKMASEGIKDPSKALGILTQQIKNAGNAGEANKLAIETFGARAGPDMAAAIREGRFEFGALVKQIDKGKGTIRGTGKDTMDLGEHWKVLSNRLKVLVEPIATKVFAAVGQGMKDVTRFMRELTTEGSETQKKFGPIMDALVFAGKVLWFAYKKFTGNIVKAFEGMAVAARFVAAAVDFLKKIPDRVSKIFKQTVNAITGFFKDLYQKGRQAASNVISGVTDFLSSLPNKFLNAVKGIGTTIGNTIRDVIKAAVNWVIEKWNSIEFSVNLPGPAPTVTVGTPNIGTLASGTRFWSGGPALVGERGPELLDLPRGSRVTPAGATRQIVERMASRGGGGDVNFNGDIVTVGDGNPDAGHLLQLIGRQLRQAGA